VLEARPDRSAVRATAQESVRVKSTLYLETPLVTSPQVVSSSHTYTRLVTALRSRQQFRIAHVFTVGIIRRSGNIAHPSLPISLRGVITICGSPITSVSATPFTNRTTRIGRPGNPLSP
jgi:hypothetical protein